MGILEKPGRRLRPGEHDAEILVAIAISNRF